MAWRVTDNLIDGTLDNTTPAKVTGELRFLGRKRPVRVDLAGDFAGECRGKRLALKHAEPRERNRILPDRRAGSYMTGFAAVQRGEVGRMMVDDCGAYLEWFGEKNGRVVIELAVAEVEVVTRNT